MNNKVKTLNHLIHSKKLLKKVDSLLGEMSNLFNEVMKGPVTDVNILRDGIPQIEEDLEWHIEQAREDLERYKTDKAGHLLKNALSDLAMASAEAKTVSERLDFIVKDEKSIEDTMFILGCKG